MTGKKKINTLKYLNYTKDYIIVYKDKGEILALTDLDYGGDPDNRKSTS